jgi:hypothetical protein
MEMRTLARSVLPLCVQVVVEPAWHGLTVGTMFKVRSILVKLRLCLFNARMTRTMKETEVLLSRDSGVVLKQHLGVRATTAVNAKRVNKVDGMDKTPASGVGHVGGNMRKPYISAL